MAKKNKVYDAETRQFVIPANERQKDLVKSIFNNWITVVQGSAGTGKANPNDTLILTPTNGYVRLDSIKEGDFVVGQDGLPTKVLRIFPKGKLDIYKLTFSDGTTAECCEDHLWNIKTAEEETYKTLPLKDFISKIDSENYQIPICKPIQFQEKDLPIDPYHLGSILSNVHKIYATKLKEKFIPLNYLYSSITQRLALLQGLMDARGHITPNKEVIYSCDSQQLTEDVRFLVQSLGGIAIISNLPEEKQYRLQILLPENINPFKTAKYVALKEQVNFSRVIVSAQLIGQKESRCILVDNKDHLFLLENCIVTHNTLLSIQSLYKLYKHRQINKIYVVRLVAETFGEKIGSLPGELKEKTSYCLGPIMDNLSKFLPAGEIQYLVDKNVIESIPVSHCRGRSFSEAGLLVEEAQNMSDSMVFCIITRLAGTDSRLVINGDPMQTDFADRNGILYAAHLLKNLEGVGNIYMDDKHIIRHPLLSEILKRAKALQSDTQKLRVI